ncbi:MAG TPA: hypothetical protein VML75_14885 [Kofleriaceae bacterium]|nr:hypothetical protein [Kofleriaceae bacterium]
MLLGNHLLTRVARIWQHRERIEREAAALFEHHAGELAELGAPAAVTGLAARAAIDERDHARRCRALVERFHPGLAPLEPAPTQALGPRHASRRDRALYASVAMSCVTETLSAALLLHMRARARDELVAETVHHILKDEIDHSRLGWAHLAAEARDLDVTWLAPHIPAMLRDAMATELAPMTGPDLSAYGILAPGEVASIVDRTVATVIAPGLARFGIA